MDTARTLVGLLGIIFALAGIMVAWTFDKLAGLAILLVGAFLLILPIIAFHSDE